MTNPIIEVLISIPIIIIGILICSFFVRFIYYPTVGRSETLLEPIISSFFVIFFTILYGYWIESNGYGNGTSAHGYFFGLIVLPFTAGWVGNVILDIMATYRDRNKGKFEGS